MATKTGNKPIAGNNRATDESAAGGRRAAASKAGKPPQTDDLDRLSLVRGMILDCTVKAHAKGGQRSGVADLVRLLALEKELSESEQTTQEIKVTWVEPDTVESSKSE
jgi:hypothetical protein